MQPFELARPTSAQSAVQTLIDRSGLAGERGSALLAGGTDLLALMKDGVETPGRLVSLAEVADLAAVRRDGGSLVLGALAPLAAVAASREVRSFCPALADAFGRVGGPQIRATGTVGGNLCQRPRCWYFRRGFGLLASADGRSMVVDGDNRYHAILGNAGPAYFVTPSTVVPLLVALGAKVALLGPSGEREIPLESFYRTPAREGEREHALVDGEILTRVTVPAPASGATAASYEVRPGATLDWSQATASVVVETAGGAVTRASVVLGQMAPVPWRARAAEALLAGKRITPQVASAAGEAAVVGARPLTHNRYKVQLARVATRRALLRAAGLATEV